MKKYDYIFIGAGCAGLSLLTRMVAAGLAGGKRILVIDKSGKHTNDRTWCFWEASPGFFEPVVCKQWDRLWFHATGFSRQLDTAPYRYKMIQAIDFYNHCFQRIKNTAGIEIVHGTVSQLSFAGDIVHLAIDGQPHFFPGATVFNSLWDEATIKKQHAVYLLQHFKGWMIETPAPFFTPSEATLMDFRVSQANGTTFAYVLPLSATKALVEFTLFSEKLLKEEDYNNGLTNYLHHQLQLRDYTISATEFGVIPMTDARFPWYANGMFHIGTAGGQTKASSGYTFQFIQKQTAAIVQQLLQGSFGPLNKPGGSAKRYQFYDAVLLHVLAHQYASGSEVFSTLFKKNSPQAIFAFLDNETTRWQDLGIISTLPTLPFLKAALKQLF
ncbi:MAG: lycopene cyclase family protein [Chitinophagaceae bacterium]